MKRQLIAARYGQDPRAVDEWAADDASDALSVLQATGVLIGGSDE